MGGGCFPKPGIENVTAGLFIFGISFLINKLNTENLKLGVFHDKLLSSYLPQSGE
jgi:hypothetical protein